MNREGVRYVEVRDILRLVAWFGILTGMIEVALLAVIKFGSLASAPAGWASPDERLRHSYLWLSAQVVWMAPLALTVLLAVPATILGLAGQFARGLRSLRLATGTLAFCCFSSLLNIYPRLYLAAVVLLAAGIGMQVSRFVDAKSEQFLGMVRKSTKWMVGVVVVLALAINIGGVVRERLRLGTLEQLPVGLPNVLLLILDTVRAPNMSLYGYAKETTPNLDRLAASAVTFDMAVATSPWTLPSHVSMFTGRLPYEFDVNFLGPYGGEHATIAEVLSRRGFVTAGFAGNLVYCTAESGITSGFTHYEDHQLVVSEFVKSTALGRRLERMALFHNALSHFDTFGDKDATEVTNEFLNWLDGRPDERPFFAFLNYIDAHEPYLPPARFEEMLGTGTQRRQTLNEYFIRWAARAGRAQMTSEELAAEIAAYDGTIAYVDEQVGILLDRLRQVGLLDNTIVIVASDHGEQFGEHGLHVHGNSLFLPNLHVPLVVAYGDHLPAGTRVTTPVSIRDIPATVLGMLGMAGANPFPGISLERFWASADAEVEENTEPAFSELTDIRGMPTVKSIIVGRYHYIWGENRVEALFDLESDPDELNSLMTRENLDLITTMRRLMAPHVRGDPEVWERLPQNE